MPKARCGLGSCKQMLNRKIHAMHYHRLTKHDLCNGCGDILTYTGQRSLGKYREEHICENTFGQATFSSAVLGYPDIHCSYEHCDFMSRVLSVVKGL